MAHAAQLQQLCAALSRAEQELQQAEATTDGRGAAAAVAGARPASGPLPGSRRDPWPAQVAAVYGRLVGLIGQGMVLFEPYKRHETAEAELHGLAGCPDLLGRHVPALVRVVSRRLTSLMLRVAEPAPASGGRRQEQAGGNVQRAAHIVEAVAKCTYVLCGLVDMARSGMVAQDHAKATAALKLARQQVLHDVAGPEQLGALAAAADALALALAVPSRGAATGSPQLNDAWHNALQAAGAAAQVCRLTGPALVDKDDAARPNMRRLAEALRQSDLVEALCRALLAPERLLQAGTCMPPHLQGYTAAQFWGTAAYTALQGISDLACAACGGGAGAGAGATAAPVALSSVLAGPAVQRFMRVVPAAALLQAPPPTPPDAMPPERLLDLLSPLPSAADAAALLLADGLPPLPEDLQRPHVYWNPPLNSGRMAEAADMLLNTCSSWVLLLTTESVPRAVRAACPPPHELLELLLAQLSLTLHNPKLAVWDAQEEDFLPSNTLGSACRVVLAMPRSDVPLYAEAAGKLLHAHFVAALALTRWHDAAPATPGAAAAAAGAARCQRIGFGVKAFQDQLYRIQDCAAKWAFDRNTEAESACPPGSLKGALADDLQQRGTGRLADELLRWHVRNLPWLQAAGALGVIQQCICATAYVLRAVCRAPRAMVGAAAAVTSPAGVAGGTAGVDAQAGGRHSTQGSQAPRAEAGGGAAHRRPGRHGGRQEPEPGPAPHAHQLSLAAPSLRRAARDLGSLLSAAKAARVVAPLLCNAGAGPQQGADLLAIADYLTMLLSEGCWVVDQGVPAGEPRGSNQVVLLAAWPVLLDASTRLACAVLHAHLRGPWAPLMQGTGLAGPGKAPLLLASALLAQTGAVQQLAIMAQEAVAAGQPSLQPGGSTGALLLRTLQAPATEALLALTAEYLARHPRVTDPSGSQAFQTVLSWTLQLLLCMAAVPWLHQLARDWLLPPQLGAAGGGSGEGPGGDVDGGGRAHVPAGRSSSGGLPPYDVASLQAGRLLAAFEQHDMRDHTQTNRLRDLVAALRQDDAPSFGVLLQILANAQTSHSLPELPAAAPDVRLLRLCGNPCCTNLEGASEQDLPQLRCAGCGAVAYCGQGCQAQHWRTGGHKQECAVAWQRARGGSAATVEGA